MEYVSYIDFKPPIFNFTVKKGKQEKVIEICDTYIALDTETSHNHNETDPLAWVYQWDFRFFNTHVYGRHAADLVNALDKIKQVNDICETETTERKIVIYVHNLSYDWHYLKEFIRRKYPESKENTIAVSQHRLISWTIDGLEFRCSFRLCLKSLSAWQKSLHTKHVKLIDTIDYNVIRYPDSILTRRDWRYMFADVDVLHECIQAQMQMYGDNIMSIPLTITGYVRKSARQNFKANKNNRRAFLQTRLSPHQYELLREEFAGGITHGNRYMAGDKITGCIKHRDFASHYPSQQRCYYAPVSAFLYRWRFKGKLLDLNLFYQWLNKYCCIAKIAVTYAKIFPGITMPYAQKSKWDLHANKKNNIIADNGRILCFKGYTEIVVNEIDMKWILKQYDIHYRVLEVHTALRGKYPEYLRKTVDDYFRGKTEYKDKVKQLEKAGVSDDEEEMITAQKDLLRSKGGLNGIYGMSATDPVRRIIAENPLTGKWGSKTKNGNIPDDLNAYYSSYNNFMAYQLGVWTTAGARNELMEFIELIGYNNFIYADTDSIFYLSTPEIEERIEVKNAEFRRINDRDGNYIDINNRRVYYNQFELESEEITEFKFLHAKCYAYVLSNDELKCVIAGVVKHGRNRTSRVKELGTIDNLEVGKVFYNCGGTGVIYTFCKPETVTLQGHTLEIASASIIVNTTKTLKDQLSATEEMIIRFETDDSQFM